MKGFWAGVGLIIRTYIKCFEGMHLISCPKWVKNFVKDKNIHFCKLKLEPKSGSFCHLIQTWLEFSKGQCLHIYTPLIPTITSKHRGQNKSMYILLSKCHMLLKYEHL